MSVEITLNVNQVDHQENSPIKQPQTPETRSDSSKMFRMAAGAQVLMSSGKQALNYVTSRIGTWTGDYVKQDTINKVKNVTGDLIGLGVAVAMGPVATAGYLATKAITLATQIADELHRLKWENRAAAEYQRRSGNYLADRSR
jgi:hypothetical protein